jgi:hypothetical protein
VFIEEIDECLGREARNRFEGVDRPSPQGAKGKDESTVSKATGVAARRCFARPVSRSLLSALTLAPQLSREDSQGDAVRVGFSELLDGLDGLALCLGHRNPDPLGHHLNDDVQDGRIVLDRGDDAPILVA